MYCIILIDLCMWNHPCTLEISLFRSQCVILLVCCGIQLASILLKIFPSVFRRDIVSVIILLYFGGFGIRVMLTSSIELGSVSSSLIFWKSLRRIGISSLYVCWNSPVKHQAFDY